MSGEWTQPETEVVAVLRTLDQANKEARAVAKEKYPFWHQAKEEGSIVDLGTRDYLATPQASHSPDSDELVSRWLTRAGERQFILHERDSCLHYVSVKKLPLLQKSRKRSREAKARSVKVEEEFDGEFCTGTFATGDDGYDSLIEI